MALLRAIIYNLPEDVHMKMAKFSFFVSFVVVYFFYENNVCQEST